MARYHETHPLIGRQTWHQWLSESYQRRTVETEWVIGPKWRIAWLVYGGLNDRIGATRGQIVVCGDECIVDLRLLAQTSTTMAGAYAQRQGQKQQQQRQTGL